MYQLFRTLPDGSERLVGAGFVAHEAALAEVLDGETVIIRDGMHRRVATVVVQAERVFVTVVVLPADEVPVS